MDDLRRDVNEAFDKAQAGLGDLEGARQRITQGALAARGKPVANRMHLSASLAALLLAAIVIATLAYVRAGSQPAHGGPARPTSSPTPLSLPLTVPDTTAVILYNDPAKADQIDGMTWDGKVSGTAGWAPGLESANPSANRFGSATQITDRGGHVLGAGQFGFKGFAGTWADDGLHFCLMVPIDFLGANGVQGTLQLITPGSAPKVVAKVGRVYEQATLLVAACSVRHDRAIVVQTYGNSPGAAQYWVIQLSTGKVLWTHQFDMSNPVTVVASPQAQYIAESQVAVGGTTTIFGVDGTHVATLPDVVDGFSWDGTIVISGTLPARMRAVLWGTGKVIWTAPTGYLVVRVDPQPDGTSLAVWITTLAGQTASPTLSNLYVIASDGAVIADIKYPPA
jgi:hypothetical protein